MSLSFIPYPKRNDAPKIPTTPVGTWQKCEHQQVIEHFEAVGEELSAGWALARVDPFARARAFAHKLKLIAKRGTIDQPWPDELRLWAAMLAAYGLRNDHPRFIAEPIKVDQVVLRESLLNQFYPGPAASERILKTVAFSSTDQVTWHKEAIAFFEWPAILLTPSVEFYDDAVTDLGRRLIETFEVWQRRPEAVAQRRYFARWLYRLQRTLKRKGSTHDALWGALIRSLLPEVSHNPHEVSHSDYEKKWTGDPLLSEEENETENKKNEIWLGAPARKLTRAKLVRGFIERGGTRHVAGKPPKGLAPALCFIDDETPISIFDIERDPEAFNNPNEQIEVFKEQAIFLATASGFRIEKSKATGQAGPWTQFDPNRVLVINQPQVKSELSGKTAPEKAIYCALPLTKFGLDISDAATSPSSVKIDSPTPGLRDRVNVALPLQGWGVCTYSKHYTFAGINEGDGADVRSFDAVPFMGAWPASTVKLGAVPRYFYYNRGEAVPEKTLRIVPTDSPIDLETTNLCFATEGRVPYFSVQYATTRVDWHHAGYVFPNVEWETKDTSTNTARWLVGVDFGSTNTAVHFVAQHKAGTVLGLEADLIDSEGFRPEALLEPSDPDPEAYDTYISRNFIGLQVPNPLSTCLRLRKKNYAIEWQKSFESYVLMPDDPTGGRMEPAQIQEYLKFDLKWLKEDDRKYVKAFLLKLIQIVLAGLRSRGASPESEVELRFAYPSAFTRENIAEFKKDIAEVIALVAEKTGFAKIATSTQLQTESIAVIRYYKTQEKSADDGTVYVDVGGGTTDIGVTEQRTGMDPVDKVALHSSIRYAGRWLLCDPIVKHLSKHVAAKGSGETYTNAFGSIERLQAFAGNDGLIDIGRNIVETALKRKHTQFETWWRMIGNAPNARVVEEVYCKGAALFFYFGIVCKHVKLPAQLSICLAGNGSSAFKWIFEADPEQRTPFLAEMFQRGLAHAGVAEADRPAEIKIEFSKHAKQEVAIGLAQVDDNLSIPHAAKGFVVGEIAKVDAALCQPTDKLPDPDFTRVICDPKLPTFVAFVSAYNEVLTKAIEGNKKRERFLLSEIEGKLKDVPAHEQQNRLRQISNAVEQSIAPSDKSAVQGWSGLPVLLAAVSKYWDRYRNPA